MSMDAALNSGDITKLGIGVIAVIVVIGIVLSLIISKLIARVIVLIVVVVLAVIVWQQRTSLKNDFDKCKFNATFFGVHFDAPQSLVKTCRQSKH